MNYSIGIETQIRSLTRLLDDLQAGKLQVPPFQRDFVWTRDDIKELFESIKNNYPIGSILIWKPNPGNNWKELKSVGGFKLPQDPSQQTVFLLDGYQRLSSLFGCLINTDKAGLETDESVDRASLYDLYFDLEEEAFVYLRNTPEYYQVPVHILMSTSDFRQYSRKNIEPNSNDERLDVYLDRADAFSRTLVDYKLAVIEISGANLSDAVNIFSRINSKGTGISYDYMVNALSYSEDFNFSIEIDNLKEELSRFHFEGITRNNLFRCYQSAFDDRMYFDNSNIEKLASRKDFKDVVKSLKTSILKAVDFLFRELNVVEYKLLPYNVQLIFIMTFFNRIEEPTKKQLQELKRWFWITTYSNYFTIYSLSNQRKAFQQFLKFISGDTGNSVYSDDPSVSFRTLPFPKTVSLSAVRCKAMILFELQIFRERSKKRPTSYGLTLCKLNADLPSSTENIIPTYVVKDAKSYSSYLTSSNSLNDEFFNYSHLIPTDTDAVNSRILERRRELIMHEEQIFVENLGMKYSK